jgi:DNA-binding winged helix-turn-helix (wHTH) protein
VSEGQIRVCVLETVSISSPGGAAVPIGSLQQKIMLTLLVAHRARSVSVDRIAEELWGECPPRRWLASIRTLANSLRRLAGDKDFVNWTGRGYQLHKNVDVVDTDIDQMLRCTEEARVALDDGRPADAEVAARRGLRFYGGGPWTTDCWYWGDLAADTYCLLGRALLAQDEHLRCLLELSQAPEDLLWHDGLSGCLKLARQAMAATPVF